MDPSTHEVRLASWRTIIEQCQARPKGQSARQWLAENDVPEKKYYYWLRRVRKAALDEDTVLPSTQTSNKQLPTVSFVEFPAASGIVPDECVPAVKITAKETTFEISRAVSDSLMIELVKAVAHAL